MGCTSSAPSMDGYISDSYSVKNEITNDDAEANKEFGSKDVKLVLPSCDTLEKNLELAGQNSIKNGTNSEEPHVERAVTTSLTTNELNDEERKEKHDTNLGNSDYHLKNDYENHNAEQYTTLREVVDRVLLDSTIIQQNQPNNDVDDYDYDKKDDEKSIIESDPPSEIVDIVEEMKAQEDNMENTVEESTSPSQSECGRATRWEALADIAAELPPTLAVDPITGQIYSLAK